MGAVVAIPKDAVTLTVEAKILLDGKLRTAKRTLGVDEVRHAIDLFEKTLDGEYPLYGLKADMEDKA